MSMDSCARIIQRQGFLVQLGQRRLMLAAPRVCRSSRAEAATQQAAEHGKETRTGADTRSSRRQSGAKVAADSDFQTTR